MSAPKIVFLQERTLPNGVRTVFDAPTHPSKGLLSAYLVRLIGTITPAGAATLTYDKLKAIVEEWITSLTISAPRYNSQLCSANLDGADWLRFYEVKAEKTVPAEFGDTKVDPYSEAALTGATPYAFEIDLPVLFEEPRLGADRLWTAPPAVLFRGDVSLAIQTDADGTVSDGAVNHVITAAKARWFAIVEHGDNKRLPVIHRFEKRTYAADSIDVGRGIPSVLLDVRAPDADVSYSINADGTDQNEGPVNGEDLSANYRLASDAFVPESEEYTPLAFMGADTTVNEMLHIKRAYSLKLTGASTGTLLMDFMSEPDQLIKRNVAIANGIEPETAQSVPITPNNAPLGQVYAPIAIGGPRTLAANAANTQRMAPTVPAGSSAAQVAAAIAGK